MNALSRSRIVAFASAVSLGIASASARADIFAATCAAGPSGSGQDIAIMNASTGARVALPPVVNSVDTELDPSITTDGRKLVFRRTSPTGVNRLLMVDLVTGQSADVFTGLEISQTPIFGSTITPGGTLVFTGRRFSQSFLGFSFPRIFSTVVVSFPSAPFSHTTVTASRHNFQNPGIVTDVAASSPGLVVMEVGTLLGSLVLDNLTRNSSAALRSASADYSQPALEAGGPEFVFFKQRRLVNNVLQDGDIVFRPATAEGFPGTPTRVLGGVSTSADESQPALTSDARYLAFVRGGTGGNDRLFVWDSQTQTMLNSNGVDLGLQDTSSRCGSLSLYTRSLIGSSVISQAGNVTVSLVSTASIGIFVQRIVGKTELLGKKTWELETVGRVPLGSYGAGNVFTHWDFEVNGEPLPPGKYLVTLRAVEDTVEGTVVRELGEPQVLRIEKEKKEH
jgi:hypothetical protein